MKTAKASSRENLNTYYTVIAHGYDSGMSFPTSVNANLHGNNKAMLFPDDRVHQENQLHSGISDTVWLARVMSHTVFYGV